MRSPSGSAPASRASPASRFRRSTMSVQISGRVTSSTRSWWWYSAESGTYGARWSAPSRSVSPISSWNPSQVRCSARSSSWCSSSCSSRSVRAGCLPSRAGQWKREQLSARSHTGPGQLRLHLGAGRHRRAGPSPQPGAAIILAVRSVDLLRLAVWKIYLLRDPRFGPRPDLGLLRHPLAWPWGLLRARWLRDGHVSDASDRHPRRLRQPDPAGLHGVPELEGTSGLLVWLPAFPLRAIDGRAGAGLARLRVRLVRVPLARHGRLSLYHHPDADLCADARILPQ